MTPGSNRKSVKRISEKNTISIKDIWGNSKENTDRKKMKRKFGIETDVKKLIDGIEASLGQVVNDGKVDSLSIIKKQNTKIESQLDRNIEIEKE